MSRSISFVLFCGVLVFAAVWKLAPGFLERAIPYLASSHANEPRPPAPLPEPVEKTDGKGSRQARSPQPAESAQTPSAAATVAATGIVDGDAANKPFESSTESPVFRISTEGTPLYAANSPGARVLRVLKKGDIVQPQFRFINPGPEWTYVSLADKRVSGFLRSSSLRNPADETTP